MPSYYDNVLEMETLLSAEQFVIDDLTDQIEKHQNNLFVMLADEKGLTVWEKSMNIIPSAEIEDRRLAIIQRLLPPKPITKRYMNELLTLLNIDAKLTVNDFHVSISIETTDNNAINRLNDILRRYLPANLTYTSLNLVSTSTSGKTMIGTGKSFGKTIANKGGI